MKTEIKCQYYSEEDVVRDWVKEVDGKLIKMHLEYGIGKCSKMKKIVGCNGAIKFCERKKRLKQGGE